MALIHRFSSDVASFERFDELILKDEVSDFLFLDFLYFLISAFRGNLATSGHKTVFSRLIRLLLQAYFKDLFLFVSHYCSDNLKVHFLWRLIFTCEELLRFNEKQVALDLILYVSFTLRDSILRVAQYLFPSFSCKLHWDHVKLECLCRRELFIDLFAERNLIIGHLQLWFFLWWTHFFLKRVRSHSSNSNFLIRAHVKVKDGLSLGWVDTFHHVVKLTLNVLWLDWWLLDLCWGFISWVLCMLGRGNKVIHWNFRSFSGT